MDFLELVRRAAEFCGIELVGWCVMSNHFHLLVYLPEPQPVDEHETLRRYGVLKGGKRAEAVESMFAGWRKQGDVGERLVFEWLQCQHRRMYDVGNFMKIVKQWFTEEYNRRHSHKGTLWESAYYDRVVPRSVADMAKCLGYIHLNPIRAAATDRFDGYVWSSFSAFRKGDPIATRGMRFVYGEEMTIEEIDACHEALLEDLIEEEKLKRAEEIARKRAAGYKMPADMLTTEAMIAQRAAHLEVVRRAAMELRSEGMEKRGRKGAEDEVVLAALAADPGMDVMQLARQLGISKSAAYRQIGELKRKGLLLQEGRGGNWMFPSGKTGQT